jgi:hypothetical protein
MKESALLFHDLIFIGFFFQKGGILSRQEPKLKLRQIYLLANLAAWYVEIESVSIANSSAF